MVLEARIGRMLYKLGKDYTFKIKGTPITTDTFYRDETADYTTISLRAVIFPSRSYDVHSNVLHYEKAIGVEEVGIIDVYLLQENCPVDIGDYVVVGTVWYKLRSKEIFGDAYFIFEGRVEKPP
jgi:hypothetical protein